MIPMAFLIRYVPPAGGAQVSGRLGAMIGWMVRSQREA